MSEKGAEVPEQLFKVLRSDGSPYHGGSGSWPLPNGKPGAWVEVGGELEPCRNGLHLCRPADLLSWLGPAIFTAEYEGERVDCDDKIVVRRARLTGVTAWDDRMARLFAADCAERVLPIFERECPGDDRPWRAIVAARAFANREIDAAARDAARAAARAAAGAAAGAAAWDAAGAAAWAAEREWQMARLMELLSERTP